jgi:hypothetical protein
MHHTVEVSKRFAKRKNPSGAHRGFAGTAAAPIASPSWALHLRFTTSATVGTTRAATSSSLTSLRTRRMAVFSKPGGAGSRPTWLVQILCALFFIGLLP